ncbi:flavodoxin domain-containing protein [Burkholderia gladioli pv. gladioli]|uniref:Flavodoxin family protein n=1 Tax=Burkholderia gladioli TaxID=28095 RepID=A0A095G2K2_BURGA|nr:flavodoxin domain-containing protein [Burkholderia gladioli]AJW97153.1 flavodoxin family protein [Burkholderia gladioli]ASD79974.1 nitric oxide synthase [Burkholderia gladioli pv. gladioli]AWY54780.1 nitric oxide synthase [Burkholderia gladioli pv. gladioli]KGC11572.1 flavodoxin family protein [Burkholderia gladioli]MDJ1164234.1 flavodoxin domain-containing protein [Burkholderia gladioli pv. gladioli]
MSTLITILVATMSGTAEMVAEEMAGSLKEQSVRARIAMMDEVSIGELTEGDYLICSSTYGTGDVPDNGKRLYESLRAHRPVLRGIRYGVFGLGDSVYPNTFCFGAKQFDELFSELGAVRIGSQFYHDRRSTVYPEDAAVEWVRTWLTALSATATSSCREPQT